MSCNKCVCEKSVRTACILCFTFICLCAPISSSAQSLEQTYKAELTRLKADQTAFLGNMLFIMIIDSTVAGAP